MISIVKLNTFYAEMEVKWNIITFITTFYIAHTLYKLCYSMYLYKSPCNIMAKKKSSLGADGWAIFLSIEKKNWVIIIIIFKGFAY